MKAAYCTKYGPPEVLEIRDVPKPEPRSNEVCIKVIAAPVTASDCIVRGFKMPTFSFMGIMMRLVVGIRKPRNPILGMVFAGEIQSMGEGVTKYKVGDQVFGWTLGSAMAMNFGTHAEYKCLPENSAMALMPKNTSFEEAATIPYGSGMALYFLEKAQIKNGAKVLIYGASGSIGTKAVQIAARHYGADVTAVCSDKNFDLVKKLGATKVIDYTQPDAVDKLEKYDLVFDAVGDTKSSELKDRCKTALTDSGQYISVDKGSPTQSAEQMDFIRKLVEEGKLTASIEKIYPLEEIVAAHQHVDTGHKKGSVILKIV